jgi:hypothetical protein
LLSFLERRIDRAAIVINARTAPTRPDRDANMAQLHREVNETFRALGEQMGGDVVLHAPALQSGEEVARRAGFMFVCSRSVAGRVRQPAGAVLLTLTGLAQAKAAVCARSQRAPLNTLLCFAGRTATMVPDASMVITAHDIDDMNTARVGGLGRMKATGDMGVG